MSATWNVSGKNVPVIADIEKILYGAGKGDKQDKNKVGTVLYNRGASVVIASVEAIRAAQAIFGKGKVISGEQIRWGLENLNINNAWLAQLAATGLLPKIKTSCANHEGSGMVKIQQWYGTKWNIVTPDWIDGNKSLIHPLFMANAAKYAKEKSITSGCMKGGLVTLFWHWIRLF